MSVAKKSYVVAEQYERFIEHEVAVGNFDSASDVVEAGLKLLEEAKLAELRRLIDEGDADFAAGRYQEFNSAEELTAYIMRRVHGD
jgi:antitoxin ParD1/3/4